MGDQKNDLSTGHGIGGGTHASTIVEAGSGGETTTHELSTPELVKLSLSFRSKFERSSAVDDISEAITAMQRAVDRTSDKARNLPAMLGMLAVFLGERFERTGNLLDLNEAISNQIRAMLHIPESHPDFPKHLINLGNSFISHFERTGELAVLTEAISLQSRAARLIPDGHANLPVTLNSLGMSFRLRFSRTQDVQDISDAISTLRKAVSIAPEGHRVKPMLLGNLGSALDSRFVSAGDLQDLAEAIPLHTQAVHLTPQSDPTLPVLLCNLANSLSQRFERIGDLPDLNRAISSLGQAVHLLPEGHVEQPAILSSLGMSLTMRFRSAGSLSDITEAVSVQRRGVNLTADGDTRLSAYLTNLGNSFFHRFSRNGDFSDLTEAILILKQAINISPEGHASIPGRLANLAIALCCRFERLGDPQDINEAVSLDKRAVDLTPEGNEGRASRLSNLGYSLVSRFERLGNLSDLAEAISAQTLAVDISPKDDVGRSSRLANLGSSLMLRFKQTGDVRDLEAAQRKQRKAIELTPKDHESTPRLQYYLALTSQEYFSETTLLEHLSASLAAFRSAATSTCGSLRTRVVAAKLWVELLGSDHPVPPEAILALDTVISLLALIAGLEQTVKGRYAVLEEHPVLPLEAAATALQLEMPKKALEWLEQGRCLVWGQQNQLRTPLDELRIHDAGLADRVMDIAKGLENAGSSARTSHSDVPISTRYSLRDEAGNHARLAAEWEGLVTSVRSITGFESFLQPVPFARLVQHLPASGAVVVINVHKIRCDAIALVAGSSEPRHIPLPDFSLEKAMKYRSDLKTYLHSQGIRMRGCVGDCDDRNGGDRDIVDRTEFQAMEINDGVPMRAIGTHRAKGSVRSVLRGLWIQVVKPIVNALALLKKDRSSEEELPRIWWCPTGPLSFLPIHAAGEYGGVTSECLLDYAVPSYTPTLSALSHRVRDDHQINPALAGLLLTCQPAPPGAGNIPGTTTEVQRIYTKALENGFRAEKLEGDAVTPEEYLTHMEDFSCVHLACHGTQDPADPRQSRFLFHKGELTLNEIAQHEAVHLAAGMLAAGYRRVVATMWAIGDEHAPQVADDFYQYLWTHREGGSEAHFDGSQSARALRHAIQLLRGRTGTSDASLLAWIPYVHFGY